MDFIRIGKNVEKYLDKQQASMLGNSHLISMTIKRLDLYVDTFHIEMKELLQAENVAVEPNFLSNLRKPAVQTVDLARLGDPDKIKGKLVALSNQLANETVRRARNIRHFLTGQPEDVDRYRAYVREEIHRTIDFNYQGTLLHRIITAILYELNVWEWDRSVSKLERYYQEIRSPRVIDEFRAQGDHVMESFIKGIVAPYRSYFAECLREYERICFRGDERKDDQLDVPVIVVDEQMSAEETEPGGESAAENEWVLVPDKETRVEASVVILETGVLPESGLEMRIEEKRVAGSREAEQETERNLMSLEDLKLLSVMCGNGETIQLDPKLASEDFQRELLRLILLQIVRDDADNHNRRLTIL